MLLSGCCYCCSPFSDVLERRVLNSQTVLASAHHTDSKGLTHFFTSDTNKHISTVTGVAAMFTVTSPTETSEGGHSVGGNLLF